MNTKALERRIKRHIIAGENKVFLALQPGLEKAGESELISMGLDYKKEAEPGSLTCTAGLENIWKLVLCGRSFSRIYLRLAEFKADGFKDLKQKLTRIDWEMYLRAGSSFKIRISTKHCRIHVEDKILKVLNHNLKEHFQNLDVIPPRFDISPENDPAVQTIVIRGVDNRFSISLDAGGGSLYERGYRSYVNEAPLKENIAASLLELSPLGQNCCLLDFMSGSGTFSLEALMMSASLPVRYRRFPFEYWPSFRPARYEWLKKTIHESQTTSWKIIMRDQNPEALELGRKNLEQQENLSSLQSSNIKMEQMDFMGNPPPPLNKEDAPFLILNPPYGKRLPLKDQMKFFRDLGQTIKTHYKGIPWGIIVPGLECEKALDLHWDTKYLFKNGGFPVSYILGKYE